MARDKVHSSKDYTYKSSGSYKAVDKAKMTAHAERVRKDVIPKLKDQAEKKEAGAQRLRLKGAV